MPSTTDDHHHDDDDGDHLPLLLSRPSPPHKQQPSHIHLMQDEKRSLENGIE